MEGLAGEVGHDDGVLAAREEQGGTLELGRGLAEDEYRLGLELGEVVDLVGGSFFVHVVLLVKFRPQRGKSILPRAAPRRRAREASSSSASVSMTRSGRSGSSNRSPAGELLHLARLHLRVEALRIALRAGLVGGPDIDLEEVVVADDPAGEPAQFVVRGDEGGDDDDAAVGEEFRDLGDAADVLEAVLVGEAEIAVQPDAHVVAVEHLDEPARGVEFAFETVGKGAFPPIRSARTSRSRRPTGRGVPPSPRAEACGRKRDRDVRGWRS